MTNCPKNSALPRDFAGPIYARWSVRLAWLAVLIAVGRVAAEPGQSVESDGRLLTAALQPSLQPLRYTTRADDPVDDGVARISPWKSIPLDPVFGGEWIVAGDVDGDGEVEIVSARNHNAGDVHFTSSVVVHKLDGSVLWRWGRADPGRFLLHHDVACQVYDWDGDGDQEVIVATDQAVVEIDGASGQENRRFAIPKEASDCITFCNLTGGPRPTDILVKTRYSQIWAFNRRGEQLWVVETPGGFKTAHQPRPMDIDGDGRDEIMAGFAMLNSDGTLRWALDDKDFPQGKRLAEGHLDCARVFSLGSSPSRTTVALTFCGAERMALVQGDGKLLWHLPGRHFESIDVGKVCADREGKQIVVDIPYAPRYEQPICVFDAQGALVGQILTDSSRFHRLVDWHGKGVESIVVGQPPAMYDGATGRKLAVFETPAHPDSAATRVSEEEAFICFKGDMSGDGRPDIIFIDANRATVHIYKNEHGTPRDDAPLGTGVNWTLY